MNIGMLAILILVMRRRVPIDGEKLALAIFMTILKTLTMTMMVMMMMKDVKGWRGCLSLYVAFLFRELCLLHELHL